MVTAKVGVVLVENGLEPEYIVTDIVRAEPVSDGMIRLYLAARKHRTLVMQYTVVCSLSDLARMGEEVKQMAVDRHNLAMWENFMDDRSGH